MSACGHWQETEFEGEKSARVGVGWCRMIAAQSPAHMGARRAPFSRRDGRSGVVGPTGKGASDRRASRGYASVSFSRRVRERGEYGSAKVSATSRRDDRRCATASFS